MSDPFTDLCLVGLALGVVALILIAWVICRIAGANQDIDHG